MPDDLPARILDSVREMSPEPQEFLYEALLWRGFLVGRDEIGELCLFRGSHDDDLRTLEALGFALNRLDDAEFVANIRVPEKRRVPEQGGVPKDNQSSFEFVASIGEVEESPAGVEDKKAVRLAERVLCLAPQNHMTGALRQKETEGSFFTCEYGVKAKTQELDPGVALIVKTLPVCGLRTVFSCQGHLGSTRLWPEICFHSKYDLGWAVMILEELGNYLPEFSCLKWKVDDERGGSLRHKIIFCPAESLSSAEPFGPVYTDTIVSLQMAARRLLDPRVYTPIRAAKHSMTIFEGLREALRRELRVLG